MDSKRFLLRCADKLHLPVTTRYRMFIACAKPGECAPQPRKIDQFRSINCANVAADAEKPRREGIHVAASPQVGEEKQDGVPLLRAGATQGRRF